MSNVKSPNVWFSTFGFTTLKTIENESYIKNLASKKRKR